MCATLILLLSPRGARLTKMLPDTITRLAVRGSLLFAAKKVLAF